MDGDHPDTSWLREMRGFEGGGSPTVRLVGLVPDITARKEVTVSSAQNDAGDLRYTPCEVEPRDAVRSRHDRRRYDRPKRFSDVTGLGVILSMSECSSRKGRTYAM